MVKFGVVNSPFETTNDTIGARMLTAEFIKESLPKFNWRVLENSFGLLYIGAGWFSVQGAILKGRLGIHIAKKRNKTYHVNVWVAVNESYIDLFSGDVEESLAIDTIKDAIRCYQPKIDLV